jgi:hypothetical protein
MPIKLDLFPSECRHPDHKFYTVIGCRGGPIKIPMLDLSVSRKDMVSIVITLDVIIVFGFLVGVALLDYHINREAEELDLEFVQTTDFAVKINGLPDIKSHFNQV